MAGQQHILDFRGLNQNETFTVFDAWGTEYTVEVDMPLVGVGLLLEQGEALAKGRITQDAYNDLLDTMHALLSRRKPSLTLREMKKAFTTGEMGQLISFLSSLFQGTSPAPAASLPAAPLETTPSLTPTPPRSPTRSQRAGSPRPRSTPVTTAMGR